MPTAAQQVLLRKTCGVARYVYNWAKAEWEKMYEEYRNSGKTTAKPSAYTLSKRWTLERPEWSNEVARGPQTAAILDLGKAYLNFWNKKAERPSFKKKGSSSSFTIGNSHGKIEGKSVLLTQIGWVRMREDLRFSGKILSYTVSTQAGQWYVSVQVETPEPVRPDNPSVVGIDVGIKALAVASDGTVCENPLNLRKKQKYLARMQRKLQRQVKGSARRNRTKLRISKTHLKITNIRQDRIHKFTSAIAKNHGTAVIETLDIRQMRSDGAKHLRRSLQDTAMREIHRQLEYKVSAITRAPQYFASSKTCSACGAKKPEFPCHIRTYKCERCGLVLDRDFNAALNLKNMPWVTGFKHAKSPSGEMQRAAVNPSAS
jgi:putative transposase